MVTKHDHPHLYFYNEIINVIHFGIFMWLPTHYKTILSNTQTMCAI